MSALLLNPRQMVAPDPEQQPVAAGILTAGIHLAFAAVMFLNMDWEQTIRPQASVKLWHSIPATKPDPATTVKTRRRSPQKPVEPASPKIPPAPQQVTHIAPQPHPTTIAAVNPQPPSPIVDVARPVAPDKPVFEATQIKAIEPVSQTQPATIAPMPPAPSSISDVAQPAGPQIAPARADLAAPERIRANPPAADNSQPTAVVPVTAPARSPIPAVAQPVTPQITPARADLAAPERIRADAPATESPKAVAIAPPPSDPPTQFQQQPDRKPEVDVEALRRDRTLALAEELREEESTRLNATLEREQNERSEETQKRKEERERKLAQELQEISLAAEKRRAEQDDRKAQEAAAKGIADDFRARISAKIRQRVILPPDLRGNPEAIYEVSLLPGGEVTQVQLLQSSGVLTYDAAVERAILAAQPLPVPEEPGMFHANFKTFLLSFRPKE